MQKKQSKLFKKLSDKNKGEKPIDKKPFLINVGFLRDARQKVLTFIHKHILHLNQLLFHQAIKQ